MLNRIARQQLRTGVFEFDLQYVPVQLNAGGLDFRLSKRILDGFQGRGIRLDRPQTGDLERRYEMVVSMAADLRTLILMIDVRAETRSLTSEHAVPQLP